MKIKPVKYNNLKSLANYFTGSILSSLLNFLILYLLINNFSFEKIGEYIIMVFIVNLVANTNLFGTSAAMMRYYRGNVDIEKYKNNSLIILFISTIITFLIFNIVITIFKFDYLILQDRFLANSILGLAFSESYFRLLTSHTNATKEAKLNRDLFSIKAISSFLFVSVYLLFNSSFIGLIICLFIPNVLASLYFNIKEPLFLRNIKYNSIVIKELSLYSYPIFILGLFTLLSDYSNQIFLSIDNSNNVNLANFHFYLRAITLGIGAISVINKVWQPIAMDNLYEKKEMVYSIIKKSIYAFIIITLFVVLISLGFKQLNILKYVLSDVYVNNFSIFIMLLPVLIFQFIYLVISPIFYFEKKTIIFSISNIISSSISIFISYILIYYFGLNGAVVSVILTSVILLLTLSAFYRKNKVYETIKGPLLFSSIFTVLHFIWIYFYDFIIVYALILLIMILVLLYKEKDDIKYLVKLFLK